MSQLRHLGKFTGLDLMVNKQWVPQEPITEPIDRRLKPVAFYALWDNRTIAAWAVGIGFCLSFSVGVLVGRRGR